MTGPRSRGQHAGLTREVVLATAVELVDEHGLAALSMRRLGGELGVEAMALYHHVGSKEELLDGLVEHLFAEVLSAPGGKAEGGHPGDEQAWRPVLRTFARTMVEILLAHPNLVPVVLSRPATTPQVHGLLEELLGALRDAGLHPGQALDLIYAVISLVLSHVATGGDSGNSSATRRQVLRAQDLSDFPLLEQAAREESDHRSDPFEATLEALFAWFDPEVSQV
ncbi:TetR/AcrR family transcriptional regulator [Ornithinimicrobium faecis]|uniref:TetR/AcrR family transcriptional regulator n=1 Tax=Ornithinimicrobium faecis TaxID=2934158 RepID=UPI002118BB07|nr:TetR/AcrR family transcriptional regulator C-terminal domain-containing protein [Ornithinimicrobium sp. HY1745]